MNKEFIIAFLKKHKHYFEQTYHVKRIGLFGSYVKNRQTHQSDIDILVDMPSSFDNYYELKEFLEEHFQKNVDLGLIHTIREHLKEDIHKEVIYA